MTERLYHLYARHYSGDLIRLTGYPMTHRECEINKSKFNPPTLNTILFVEAPENTEAPKFIKDPAEK